MPGDRARPIVVVPAGIGIAGVTMIMRILAAEVAVATIGMSIERVVLLQTVMVGTILRILGMVELTEVHHHLTGEDLHQAHEEVHHSNNTPEEADAIIRAKRMILDGVVLLPLLVVRGRGLLVAGVAVVVAVIQKVLVVRRVLRRRLIVVVAPAVAVDPEAAIVRENGITALAAGAAVRRGVRRPGRRIPTRMTRVVRLPKEAAAWWARRIVWIQIPLLMLMPRIPKSQPPRKTFTPRINAPSL
jgi:hypothetical protein